MSKPQLRVLLGIGLILIALTLITYQPLFSYTFQAWLVFVFFIILKNAYKEYKSHHDLQLKKKYLANFIMWVMITGIGLFNIIMILLNYTN